MQRDDVGGGGGPFAYFPVSASAIHDAASEIDRHGEGLDAIRRQVHGTHRHALSAVDGVLVDPTHEAPNDIYTRADRIAQTSTYAAGCLHLFGDFVHQHDQTSTSPRSVSLLNRAYSEAKLDDFGLDESEYEKGGAKADRDYEADWRASYAALVGPNGTLTIEYRQLQARLDIQAQAIAQMLRRGPNVPDLRVLWTLGALPSRADTVWANHDFLDLPLLRLPPDLRDGYDDERNLYDLTVEELSELAISEYGNDGFQPAGELFALRMQANDAAEEPPGPLDSLGNIVTTILADPRECFGDDASWQGCGLEVFGILPIGKPLKAIKAYRAARRLERAPEPGPEIPPIHTGRQGKHLPGHPNHNARKSILEADPHQLRKLAGTGTPMNKIPRALPGFKEAVDYGFPIGRFVSDDGDTVLESTRAMLVYAKDGIHIYPIRPRP